MASQNANTDGLSWLLMIGKVPVDERPSMMGALIAIVLLMIVSGVITCESFWNRNEFTSICGMPTTTETEDLLGSGPPLIAWCQFQKLHTIGRAIRPARDRHLHAGPHRESATVP